MVAIVSPALRVDSERAGRSFLPMRLVFVKLPKLMLLSSFALAWSALPHTATERVAKHRLE